MEIQYDFNEINGAYGNGDTYSWKKHREKSIKFLKCLLGFGIFFSGKQVENIHGDPKVLMEKR